jgi:predicted exporter
LLRKPAIPMNWIGWAAAMAVLAMLLAHRLHLTADLTAFLPASTTPAERLLVAQLRDGLAARMILIGIEGDDPARLARASKVLADRLQNEPAFELIANGQPERQQADRKILFDARYLLSANVTEQRFTQDR